MEPGSEKNFLEYCSPVPERLLWVVANLERRRAGIRYLQIFLGSPPSPICCLRGLRASLVHLLSLDCKPARTTDHL